MAKSYTELEAWGIFVGALIIGVVVTSVFWAYITIPENVKKIESEIKNATAVNLSKSINFEKPAEFLSFCKSVDGTSIWDNTGFRQCALRDVSEQNLAIMGFVCRKFNLTLSYGSFGVKCEGKR